MFILLQHLQKKYTYHDKTNLNGHLLYDYAQEADLLIANTHFRKRNGKLWTFISDCNGTKTQIDFIMVRENWRNSIATVKLIIVVLVLTIEKQVPK